ncbi:MAG: PKD domain-containing protein, partial [Methanothermobacter tenebrarum]
MQFTDTSSGAPSSWQWNFGDGGTSNVKNPTHTYSTAGNYMVSLTIANGSESKTASKSIVVRPTVQADFTFSPSNPTVGTAVQFSDRSSGNITSWSWRFGDGGTSTEKNPSHVYNSAGSYNVTLTVSDGTSSNSMTQTITIAAALTADFRYSPSSPIVGQQVQFMDNSQGLPTSWSWDFGDGANSTIKNPTHSYSQAGSFTVKLTVSDGINSSTKSNSLTVSSSSNRIITAASCELSDVQAAIGQANAGDTVVVPNGAATWTQQLVITKGIILKAATKGGVTIYANYQAPNNYAFDRASWLIVYEPSSPQTNPVFRLSGFRIISSSSTTSILNLRNDNVLYPLRKIRIDNNYFKTGTVTGRRVLGIIGAVYGVADNNIFEDGSIISYGSDASSWQNLTFDYGTGDNFYIEDNKINLTNGSVGGGAGGRYAFRNNIWTYQYSTGLYYWFDAHGNQGAGTNLSMMGVEIYNETMYFNMPSGYGVGIVDIRGGKALGYNINVIFQNSGSASARVREEYDDSLNPPETNPAGQPQHPSDCYFFLLRANGSSQVNVGIGDRVYYSSLGRYVPTEDYDFWQEKSNFNGSSGVGVGLLSQRPTSCTTEGVGWWATDENKLYRWKNGKWELYYVP